MSKKKDKEKQEVANEIKVCDCNLEEIGEAVLRAYGDGPQFVNNIRAISEKIGFEYCITYPGEIGSINIDIKDIVRHKYISLDNKNISCSDKRVLIATAISGLIIMKVNKDETKFRFSLGRGQCMAVNNALFYRLALVLLMPRPALENKLQQTHEQGIHDIGRILMHLADFFMVDVTHVAARLESLDMIEWKNQEKETS